MMPQSLQSVESWTRGSSVRRMKKQAEGEAREENQSCPILMGESAVMKRLFSVIARIAPTDSTVLITGATGTGKEVVAQTIHERSPRRNAPFVGINCSTLPETLIEAELFGYERGSF